MTDLQFDGEQPGETRKPVNMDNDVTGAKNVGETKNSSTFEIDSSLQFVYGILTDESGPVSNYYWNNLELRVGDKCVVEDDSGYSFGSVTMSRRPASLGCGCEKKERKKIKRRATAKDIEKAESLAKKEKQALNFCREKVLERDLKMRLTKVMYHFEGGRAIFFFTADGRVDFRELLKDLVHHTKVKVEMRQIGVRDEAKMLGGCGPCGEELCCSTFLSSFAPVSIRMAKNQNLSLNPSKISGVCGRLMCCLAYEEPHYKKLQARAPKLGKYVVTQDGREGKVIQLNLLQERATVIFENDSKEEFNTYDLTPRHIAQQREAEEKKRTGKEPEQRERPVTQQQQRPGSTVSSENETVTEERRDKRKKRPRRRKKKRPEGQERQGETEKKEPAPEKPKPPLSPPPASEAGGGGSSRSSRRRRQGSRSGTRRKPPTEPE